MSDFEPSPRSSKRRKVGTFGAGSPKVKTPPSTYNSITHAVSSISRRLFKSRDNEEDLVVGGRLTSIEDSAYGSKEDSVNEEDVTVTTAASAQLADGRVRGSESADELAQSEVTVTPTKSQRNRQRRKETTGKATENAADPEDEKFDDTPVHSRTSGRERRRPRRYSTGLEDTSTRSLPKGILTPSRKGNRGPRKSVAFDQDEIGVESDMGFKDLDKTSKKKTQRLRQRKSPDREDEAEQQDEGTIYHNTSNNKEKSAAAIEDELIPEIPELPDIVLATSKDASPSTIDSRLDSPKCVVLARLTSQSFTPLTNLEDEYSKLHSLLSATITAGEGNSILLLGSRGVGKSCLVETAIADLAIEYSQDFHVVRLNGFIQTDDKLALREIWRQLGREMRVEEDETAQVSSYADTMASLLHLLSHPEELAEVLEPDAPTRTTKSVVFVLDEFDLFTTHSRQTLLYNLFDIAQARKAPIAVIGCTARVDVTDSLEKRVKSRFSHRWIHISLPKSFPAFENIARAALLLEETDKYPKDQRLLKDIRRDWNNFIEKIFLPSAQVQSLLKQCFYTTKSIPQLLSSLYIHVATITSLDQSTLEPTLPSDLQAPDSVLDMLPHLPPLHLSLLISAARLDAIHNVTVVTFALVYSHYIDLVSRARLQASAAGSIAQATKLWNQDVAAAAWEDLADWEIILPAAGRGIEGGQTKMWRCDVVLEEIIGAVGGADAGMTDAMIRWCKEI